MYYIEWTLENGKKDAWRDENGDPVFFSHYMSCEMVCSVIPTRFPGTTGKIVTVDIGY